MENIVNKNKLIFLLKNTNLNKLRRRINFFAECRQHVRKYLLRVP